MRPVYLLTLRYYCQLLILAVLFYSCQTPIVLLKEIKELPAYPSASGIEYYNNHFYVIGDDATCVLQLDSDFVITDSIPVYEPAPKRIPKETKPDLEAITLVSWKKKPHLLILGSGSLAPFRNTGWLIDPATKEKTAIDLGIFYGILKNAGLRELNIEGVCSIPGSTILSNRGHKGFPKNFLVFTSPDFWQKQGTSPIKMIKVGVNDEKSEFSGVSGMAYTSRSDKLLLTVSTEHTSSVYTDGKIGKSYLWIIDNISAKKRMAAINPTRIIDLEKEDALFTGQKIESVCVIKETANFIHLALVADNDNGASTLFRLDISK